MILFAGDIIRQECARYRVKPVLVISPRRDARLIQLRRIIIARMHEEYGLGISAIGRLLHRDHTTIYHHLEFLKAQNTSPLCGPPRAELEKLVAATSWHPDSAPAVVATSPGKLKITGIWEVSNATA